MFKFLVIISAFLFNIKFADKGLYRESVNWLKLWQKFEQYLGTVLIVLLYPFKWSRVKKNSLTFFRWKWAKKVSFKTEITRKQSTQIFLKNAHFLPPDKDTYVCVSGCKKCPFVGKSGMLCFIVTSVEIRPFALYILYSKFWIWRQTYFI